MIYTNTNDDREFGDHFLEDVMQWIVNRFTPGDLYTEKELNEYIRDTSEPDDIFTYEQLEAWAKSDGWVQPTFED